MERRSKSMSPSRAAKAIARIGSISGAISIAPIMTAVLLLIRPKVAIAQELTINTM